MGLQLENIKYLYILKFNHFVGVLVARCISCNLTFSVHSGTFVEKRRIDVVYDDVQASTGSVYQPAAANVTRERDGSMEAKKDYRVQWRRGDDKLFCNVCGKGNMWKGFYRGCTKMQK